MDNFFGWVRRISEHYLMVDAQDKVAKRLGTTRPRKPQGVVEIFWRRVYVPVFYFLPARLRDGMIARMPGSHGKSWPIEPPLRGPAV